MDGVGSVGRERNLNRSNSIHHFSILIPSLKTYGVFFSQKINFHSPNIMREHAIWKRIISISKSLNFLYLVHLKDNAFNALFSLKLLDNTTLPNVLN
jgi:hypothetical protein